MKENKYDDPVFYRQYSQMPRSLEGLAAAGEWHALRALLPSFSGKRVLDLGCGYGWHCQYAAEQGALSVIGVDISENMLAGARRRNRFPQVEYVRAAIEDIAFPADSFDLVLSSLAFHYIASFADILRGVDSCLRRGGDFVFSVEHPVFTAYGSQDWHCDDDGGRVHWPVDRYFEEGVRTAVFLGEEVQKYHRTLTTYLNGLLRAGFEVTAVVEPEPEERLLASVPDMRDELRRPMMLLVASRKRAGR